MKNDIFQFDRFWRYQKYVIREVWVVLVVAYGILAVSCVVAAMLGTINHIPGFIAMCAAMLANAFWGWQLFGKSKCIREMLIPASGIEKYAARLLAFGILPWVVAAITIRCFGCVLDLSLWVIIAYSSICWVLEIVIKQYALFMWAFCSFAMIGARMLNETLGSEVFDWVVIAFTCVMVILGYILMKRMNVTLINWPNR